MIQSFTVTNPNGKSMVCELANPWKEGLAVASIDGLGPGQATINVADISSMDGGLFNSARKGIRNIVISLIFVDHDTLSIEDIRRKCYAYFPLKKLVKLKFVTNTGGLNKEYFIDGYVESNEPVIFSSQEGSTISIICNKPYFYKNTQQEQRFSTSANPEFFFPFSKDPEDATDAATKLLMGNLVNFVVASLNYEGDTDTGAVFDITFKTDVNNEYEEAQYIRIANSLTNTSNRISLDKIKTLMESIVEDFEGIKAGDRLVFSTIKGEKSLILVHNNIEYNVLSALDSSGEWVYLSNGLNILRIDKTDPNLEISAISKNKIYYYGV